MRSHTGGSGKGVKVMTYALKVVPIVAAVVFANSGSAQQPFYYDGDSVYTVTESDQRIAVRFDPESGTPHFGAAFFAAHPCLNGTFSPKLIDRGFYEYRLSDSCGYAAASANLLASAYVLRTAPSYVSPRDSTEFWVTDLVTVKFDPEVGTDSALAILEAFDLSFVDSSLFIPLLWRCAASDTHQATPLEVGNELHVLDAVAWACGSMIGSDGTLHRIPEDPYFENQYYLRNTGQTGGQSGIDIGAETAWDLVPFGAVVKVAVVDDGITAHPDLPSSRILPGFDAAGETFWEYLHDFDPRPGDSNAHGMACAGIIAAAHNDTGIAGILPTVEIIPVKIFDDHTPPIMTHQYFVGQALYFAATQGARIISNSWGYRERYDPFPEIANPIREITHANPPLWNKGCVVVFSAGNDGDGGNKNKFLKFPANMPEVITVGAIDKSGNRWEYSNHGRYGARIDVMAPTGNRGRALPSEAGDVYTMDQEGDQGYNPWISGQWDINDVDHTGIFGGTSAAAPQVAGIAAMLLSRFPWLASDTTNETIRRIINDCAVDMGEPGPDSLYGYGRARAAHALLAPMHGNLNNDGVINAIDLTFDDRPDLLQCPVAYPLESGGLRLRL